LRQHFPFFVDLGFYVHKQWGPLIVGTWDILELKP